MYDIRRSGVWQQWYGVTLRAKQWQSGGLLENGLKFFKKWLNDERGLKGFLSREKTKVSDKRMYQLNIT